MRARHIIPRSVRKLRPLRRMRRAAKRWHKQIRIHLGLAPDLADRGYMICATARTGSTHLCQLLASTGSLGRPREFFNTAARQRRDDADYPANRRVQLEIIRTQGATSNGIYGVKVIGPQLLRVGRWVDVFQDLPNLSLVRLHRRDVLAQAISLARARQTGQFISSDRARRAPAYDADEIRHGLQSVREQNAIWDEALTRADLRPLMVTYEDVLADPQAMVDRIAVLLGLELPVPINYALLAHSMQRDEQNAAWRERFLAETGDEFRHLAELATPPSPRASASAS